MRTVKHTHDTFQNYITSICLSLCMITDNNSHVFITYILMSFNKTCLSVSNLSACTAIHSLGFSCTARIFKIVSDLAFKCWAQSSISCRYFIRLHLTCNDKSQHNLTIFTLHSFNKYSNSTATYLFRNDHRIHIIHPITAKERVISNWQAILWILMAKL